MNRIAIAAISPILVLFSSCTHKTNLTVASQTLSAPTPSEHHRIARPGVLYILEYVSLKTNNGVVAFLPGRPLRLVEDKGDTIIVTDGTTQIEVSDDKLTNDLDIAGMAAKQDAEGQEQLADYLVGQRAIDETLRAGQNAVLDHDQREIAKNRAPAKPWGTSLDHGPWHERGSLSVRRWIYNPEYPESRSPPSNVYYGRY